MKTLIKTLFFFLLLTTFSAISEAQNSLTHNTGTLEVTIIDNGYIGDDTTHTYGGVVFNGNQNALFLAGFIYGQYGQGYGNQYRFMADFYNTIPLTGFYSIPNFNQCANYNLAATYYPNYNTKVESFSNAGNDFIFLRTSVSNNFEHIEDLYPGIFADWDVGNSALNRGGYVPSRNLFYTYEHGGSIDTSFYGIMGIAINGVPMAPNTMKGIITNSFAWNRIELYNFMTSAAFDTITIDADYRTFVCTGPFIINAGTTLVVDMAIVAGTSLLDLLVNADSAISCGQLILLGISSDEPVPIDYLLNQNYPNPFNPSTRISWQSPVSSWQTLNVFDVLGNEVATIVDKEMEAGYHSIDFSASNLPSSVYFYRIQSGNFISTRKMLLLK